MALKGCTSSVLSILRSLLTKFDLKVHLLGYYYTPGIYTEGYIVFVFPVVRLFVRTSVPFVELLQRLNLVTWTWGSWSEGQHDLNFTVQWFLSYILKTIWCMYIIFWKYESVGWLCWGLTSQSTIFQSCRDGAIASWVINQYFRGVKCLAQGHNTAALGFEPRTSRSGVRHSSMNQYDPTFDLKIDIGHFDLYFMVQWFCLISWRLFDVRTILFGILSQYDPKFDLKINIYWHKQERPFYKVLYLLHQ